MKLRLRSLPLALAMGYPVLACTAPVGEPTGQAIEADTISCLNEAMCEVPGAVCPSIGVVLNQPPP